MTENQLGPDNNKTEALLFPSSLKPSTIFLSDSVTLGSHNITFLDSARKLGFILDSNLSMKNHVIKICQTAYVKLKHISSVCRFLTEDAANTEDIAKTLLTSYIIYILSPFDYCSCLFMPELGYGYT